MEKEKRSVQFYANNTNEAIEMKTSLLEKGLKVNHIFTGSSVPVLIEETGYTISGAGNIRMMYGLIQKN
jgi:hypothetical protein